MPATRNRRCRVVLHIERLKQEIRRRGWATNAEAAENLGISETTLSKLLAGKQGPSAITIDLILTSLGVEYGVLFHREELS